MKPTGAIGVAILLSLLFISSCGGNGGGKTPVIIVNQLAVGASVRDTVPQGGINYYAAAVVPGALYKISITELIDDSDLLVFGADASLSHLATCSIDTTRVSGTTTPEDCVIVASASMLYFGVDGTYLTTAGGTYTVDIERPGLTGVNASIPLADTATRTGLGIYAAPVVPGQSYTIAVTGLNDDADLHVFGADGSFMSQASCSSANTQIIGTAPEDCTITATGSTLYFVVDGLFSSASTVSYTAIVASAPSVAVPANQGSIVSPSSVAVDAPLTTGQVGSAGDSFYIVSGLTSGARYTVTIAGLTGTANLTLFGSDSTFTTPAACLIDNTFLAGTSPEACTLTTTGALYFTVAAGPNSSAYVVLVSPGH